MVESLVDTDTVITHPEHRLSGSNFDGDRYVSGLRMARDIRQRLANSSKQMRSHLIADRGIDRSVESHGWLETERLRHLVPRARLARAATTTRGRVAGGGVSLVSVGPGGGAGDTVAALWLGAANGDDVEPVWARLECTNDLRSDAHDVPLAKLEDLVI